MGVEKSHHPTRGKSSAIWLAATLLLVTRAGSLAAEPFSAPPQLAASDVSLIEQQPQVDVQLSLSQAQQSPTTNDPASVELIPPPGSSSGETGEASTAAPPQSGQMEDVLRRLDALEKSVTKPAEKKTDGAKPAETVALDDWVDMSAEKWNVKFGGQLQLDSINWANHDPQVPAFNYIEFRRLRLLADGVGYGVYDFRLQVDFEPENGEGTDRPVADIKDAYLTMNELPSPLCRWRIGNFFVPFGLEQVTNDTLNIFLERSIPTQGVFTADREVGMAIYGVNDAKDFTWTFGTFVDSLSESLKERIDDNQGQRVSGRLTYLPYYDEPSNGRYLVHTGAGILYTHDQDGIARFRTRPQIHEGPFIIDSGPLAAGNYTSGNLEFATVWGPFTVQSEAFLTNVNLIAQDSAWLWGAYVHCSYFLTGENRIYERYGQHGAQFGRNQPYSNFFWVPGCCGPGAWELKGRWSNLTLNEVDAGQYNDLTLGFNWYWTDRIRIMFDYIHPVTSDDARPFGDTTSDIMGMRFDYNF
jgi:phosphate-selective porin OprO/OprP